MLMCAAVAVALVNVLELEPDEGSATMPRLLYSILLHGDVTIHKDDQTMSYQETLARI